MAKADFIAPPRITQRAARIELLAIQKELDKRLQAEDPVRWVTAKLGDTLWSIQQQILKAVRDHRKVAVASCHEIGKSFISSRAVGWWIDVHPLGEAFAITSAPTGPQVRTILWKEIGRVHTLGKLAGRVNQTEWVVKMPSGREEQVAIGRKPSDYDPTAFQGIHARYVMYVMDEACGIPLMLWEAADSLIANDNSRALAFGNPDDRNSEFANICKPGSGWHVIQVSAFQTPNFTDEPLPKHIKEQLIGKLYVEEKRRKWAKNWLWVDRNGQPSDMKHGVKVICPEGTDPASAGGVWYSKVLGLFPPESEEQTLIPSQWIAAAQNRELQPNGYEVELGVDVGGGGDASCGCVRRGDVVEIVWEDHNPDTMQTCGKVSRYLRDLGARVAKIDVIGIGRGVVDRALEQRLSVEGINVGEAADEPERFLNRRAELWWKVRERFESGQIQLPKDDTDLAEELGSIRYKRTSHNKIQIESKDDAKRRGIASPNRAEALMLAFSAPKWVLTTATWGR
jgi:hypothetical protein